ncbi:ABC transporter permease [Pelagibacterium halotolerans]|uniref:Putative sugar ABC transport system, permease protein YtfT n=1 Tax=Pelagibacterium halotolerans (strain DSM 22347 / JCM 15775 / CGMCC 1.7692 / B2) TaxID=1082931 RepID=G4RCP1_PELHB|nr:ABC transporter permease [Pelagibacterium halotolerans]AEQ50712.1 putative sugar ABC transport system, permease protein YtfT [Pelagibacterium halotolerans B2]QJR19362.1 ABC transporter permease [Pelagibacterium halotolerans]SDZ93741.1 simple sugar transport system permease protein [Pelagibacterium halotolerans]
MTRSIFSVVKPQFVALIAILLINWMLFPGFFNLFIRDGRVYGSLIDVLNRGAPVAILAIGMTAVIATRGVDLSVGAVMAIAGAVAATMVQGDGNALIVVLAAALGVGLLCGLWNGMLVATLGLQPIIATLILMVAGRGIAQTITEGFIVTFNDPGLIFLGSGSILGLPTPIIIMLTLALVTTLVMRLTALGLFIESVGINRSASSYAGLRARSLLIGVYAFAGFCAAISGIIAAADIRGADANNVGLWLELDAILAVVIGGTSLMGGRFSIPMSVIGALIIQAMNTGILVSGFPPEFNLLVKAALIIIILVVQSPLAGRIWHFAARPRTKRPEVSPK